MNKSALGFLLLPLLLYGQGTTSRVVGTVVDASGAAVAGAKVDLTNQGTQAAFHTQTSGAGTYVFDSVQVGTYTVAVTADGFKKFQSVDNAVTIGQPSTVNVSLEVGAASQAVEVSGTAEQVQTSTSGNIGNLLTGRSVRELPIVGTRGRNPLDLVLIQPGVVSGSNTGGGIHVNGARDRSWNYTVDGIDSNETSAGGSNLSPVRLNPDAVAEYRAITSNPTADYGRNSGGQVSFVTSSGTNEFHGTAFYFYRTPRLNATEYNNLINGLGKPQFVQNIYGGSMGGPIVRNRLFAFANVQALAASNSFQVTRTVYTATARQGILRYVNGGRNLPSGVTGASVNAAGNVLPGVNVGTYNVVTNDPGRGGLDRATQALIAQAPLPNNFAVGDGLNTAGFNFAGGQQERQHDETFKVDFILNSKNTFYFRGSWGSQDTNCDNANIGLEVFPGTGCLVNTVREPRSFAANWRWNPSPNLTNELVAGQNHFAFLFQQPTADLNRVTLVPVGVPVDNTAQYDFANVRTLNTWQVVDNLSYSTGAHTFKVGTNLRYQKQDDLRGSIAGVNSTTEADFSTAANPVDPVSFRLPAGLNRTFDLATFQSNINFLLGRVGTVTRGFVAQGGRFATGQLPFQATWPEYDFYGQDTWRVRPNLTVDLGLRWEIKMAPGSTTNTITRPNQVVAIGAPANNNLTWVPGQLFNNAWRNFGPSVGFAWDPFGSGKTSIRGNYRIAYDRLNTFSLSSAVFANLPGSVTSSNDQQYGINGGRLAALSPLSPPGIAPADLTTPATYGNGSVTVVDPSLKMPTTHQWGFSVQRQISGKTIVEADYIGRRAYHLFGGYNINQTDITSNGFLDAFNVVKAGGDSPLINSLTSADSRRQAGETGSQMVRRLFAAQLSTNSVASLANSLATRIQGTRSVIALSGQNPNFFIPYNQFNGGSGASGGFNVIDSNDFSTYHALQVQLQRRLSSGLEGQVAYSFSKSLDTRSFDPSFTIVSTGSVQSAGNTPLDIYNRRANYALSDFDRRHVLQSYLVYEAPFGKGHRFLSNANGFIQRLVGGWQVSGFITWESGRPFTVFSGSNTFSNARQTPASCSGCTSSDGELFIDPSSSFYAYFNDAQKAQFSLPAAGSFSNTGRNFFRGPGYFDIDATFAKNIYFTGDTRYRLQIRADVVNLTNHPNFGFPTAIFTSSTFGRIRDSMDSNYQPRKFQLGAKFYF